MSNTQNFNRYDCPNCGSEQGAFQGNSEWGHSYMCCSSECGQEIKNKLSINEDKKEYKKLLKKIDTLRSRALKIRHSGIDTYESFFEI